MNNIKERIKIIQILIKILQILKIKWKIENLNGQEIIEINIYTKMEGNLKEMNHMILL